VFCKQDENNRKQLREERMMDRVIV